MATIEKRGDSYRITVSAGYNSKGEQQRRRMTWKPDPGMTERQIQKELNRQATLFEERCRNGGGAGGAVKFESYAEEWFTSYAERHLKESTVNRYRKLSERIYAALGAKRLDKITARDIQSFIDNLAEPGIKQHRHAKDKSKREPAALSPKTIRHYHSLISVILESAVKLDMIPANPCRRVTLPPLGESKHDDIYTLEETAQFLELLQSENWQYRMFFTLLIYSGMRRGELLGLEWGDISFDAETVSIRRNLQYTKRKGVYVDTPKTKSSARVLKLPTVIIDLLRQYHAWQSEQRIALGSQWVNTGRLFTQWNGEAMFPNTPYTWLYRFCKRNNLRPAGIHSFRHVNATLLINAGVDIRTTSAMLGHSNTSTTLNIYAHTYAAAQARASDAVANALNFEHKKKPQAQ